MGELHFDSYRLIAAMKKENIKSDAQLAKTVGVSRQMIFHLRKGSRKTASAEVVTRIAAALGVTTGYLLGQEDDMPEEVPKSIRELLRIVETLSEARREEVVRIAAELQRIDSEQANNPLPDEAMDALTRIARVLEKNPDNSEILELLRKMLRGGSGRWFIDLGKNSPDDPGDNG